MKREPSWRDQATKARPRRACQSAFASFFADLLSGSSYLRFPPVVTGLIPNGSTDPVRDRRPGEATGSQKGDPAENSKEDNLELED